MLPISVENFTARSDVSAGPAPMLQWLQIENLVVDPSYQRPICGRGRTNVDRIAREFNWRFFAPVVVSPVEGGKFAIIDGQHRTTAAALVGFDTVPCQVVIAGHEEQAAAFKAINGDTTPMSRMALHAAAVVANEAHAVKIAKVCACAEVELLRYPVPIDKQKAGQTMAVGAIARCLQNYGADTLITALQCVTQTANNEPGMLSARMIKALCEVLKNKPEWREAGTRLFDAFDAIELSSIQDAAASEAACRRLGKVQVLVERIARELTNSPEFSKPSPAVVTTLSMADSRRTAVAI
jgi:hypothetical protein